MFYVTLLYKREIITERKDVTDLSARVINKDNFNEVMNSDKKVLLDFFSSRCGPCKMVSPIVDKIADEHPEFMVGKINVDEEEELAVRFKVSGVPTFFVLEKGEIIRKTTGALREKGIIELLKM